MKHTEQIIKDAIEGGWRYKGQYPVHKYGMAPAIASFGIDGVDFKILLEQALLDPSFWQAVGKTRGWPEIGFNHYHKEVKHEGNSSCNKCPEDGLCVEEIYADYIWKLKWHTFIDNLAKGDDYETVIGKLL